MAWLAVNKNKRELIFNIKPERVGNIKIDRWELPTNNDYTKDKHYNVVCVPKGTIEKILCYKLTWENEPVEIK